VLQIGYKPHASVTSIHSAQDGLLAILRENGLAADDVAKVEVGLSPMTHVHCAWEYKAQGVTAAQMNLYYGLAMIALDGVAFTEQFQERRLAEPRAMAFVKRISAHVDKEIEAMGPVFRHASRVRVTTRDGRAFEKLSLHRRGSPENPLSAAEIVDKFHAVVAPCMKRGAAERIVSIVDRLETLADLDELVAAVAAPVASPADVAAPAHSST
jgi:2-methylcitrate dehydratase PrpD